MTVVQILVGIVSLLVGLVLIVSAGEKLAHRGQFLDILRGYELFPSRAIPAVLGSVILVEATTAVLLPFQATQTIALLAAAILFGTYAMAIGFNMARGKTDFDCGCSWGSLSQAMPETVSRYHLLRPLFFCIASALASAASHLSQPSPVFVPAQQALILGSAVLGLIVYVAGDRIMLNWPRLRSFP